MAVFSLKYRDTRPILEVELHDPAPAGSVAGTLGPVHDLTGTSSWWLHVWLSSGVKLVRAMTVYGAPTLGLLRYSWVAGDWGAAASPDANGSFTVGGLVAGPGLPLTIGKLEHRMEYEVISGSDRLTFPNDSYDTLRVVSDIGQS